jgi:hypothetical protein
MQKINVYIERRVQVYIVATSSQHPLCTDLFWFRLYLLRWKIIWTQNPDSKYVNIVSRRRLTEQQSTSNRKKNVSPSAANQVYDDNNINNGSSSI